MTDGLSIELQQSMPPKLAKVPPFPAVAMKLMSLLSEEEAGFSEIASCIATDPALAGQLIHRANAADMAHYCEVRNVQQSLSALGMDRTRDVCMTILTQGYAAASLKTEILQPCWHHTLACALIASELGRLCGLRPAELYTAALLHDIGRLGLLSAFPSDYEGILSQSAGDSDRMAELERSCFGVDHLEAGRWLAREWHLPESIARVIVEHREKPGGPLNEITIVHMACLLADFMGFAVDGKAQLPDLDEVTAALPEWVRPRLRAQLPVLKAAILKEIGQCESADSPENGVEDASARSPLPDSPEESRRAGRHPGALIVGAIAGAVVLLAAAAVLFLR